MQSSTLAKRAPILLLIAISAFYFYGLSHLPLVGPDEPRYAQVAREMLMLGDFITPTLGGHLWFEKPVLLYWLIMVAYKIMGVTEQAARVGSAAAGVLTVAAIYWLAQKVETASDDQELRNFGIWSAVVGATTLGIVVFSRAASFDVLVTMTMTWALAFFFAQELEPAQRRRTLLLAAFYAFIGLSSLAKGLVGFLPLVVVGFYFVLRRSVPPRQLTLSLVWGFPLTIAVASIWYGPVIALHGRLFIDQFIIQHHFARYLSNKYNHPQPVYFYLLILVPLTLPWTPFFIQTLGRLWPSRWRGEKPIERLRILSLVWFVLPLLFFSFSGSKLPGYLLPVVPACILLAGEGVTRFVSTETQGKLQMRAIGALALVFSLCGLIYAKRFEMITLRCAVLALLPVVVSAILISVWTNLRTAGVISVALAIVLSVGVLLNCGVDKFSQRESVKDLLQTADSRGYSNLRVCGLHVVERTAEFYASGRLIYDQNGQPAKFEGPPAVLNAARQNGGVLVLVPLEYLKQLTDLKVNKVDVIADNHVWAIVAVVPD